MSLRLFPARSFGRTRRVLRTLGATLGFFTPAIAAATQMDSFVARFTTTGAFDTSWNGSGVIQSTNPNDDFAQDVAIDSFGRIVTCGGIETGKIHLLIGRFTSAGQVDASFGLGGVTTAGNANNDVRMMGCTVDSSNRVLVVAKDETDPTAAWIIRFTANGVLDGSFGFAGHSRVAVPGAQEVSANGIEVASSGKIGIVGEARSGSAFPKLVVAQLNSNGTLDTTFNGDGIAQTNVAVFDTGLAYDTSGRAVVVAVKLTAAGAPDSLLLFRFTAAGNVDASFGGGNIPLTFSGFTSYANSRVTIDSAGRAVVAGHGHRVVDQQNALVTARFTSSGALDTGWNGTGKLVTNIPSGIRFRTIAVGSNGKVTVGGFHDFLDSRLDDARTVLVRYTSSGVLDNGFGSGGILISTLPNQVGGALQGMALDASGRAVVAGFNFR